MRWSAGSSCLGNRSYGIRSNLHFMGGQDSRQPGLIDQGFNYTWLHSLGPEQSSLWAENVSFQSQTPLEEVKKEDPKPYSSLV